VGRRRFPLDSPPTSSGSSESGDEGEGEGEGENGLYDVPGSDGGGKGGGRGGGGIRRTGREGRKGKGGIITVPEAVKRRVYNLHSIDPPAGYYV
jgi:hypothetical protein